MADNKDFFDEEFDKTVKHTERNEQHINSWYSQPAPHEVERTQRKPLYIVAICIALVVGFALGWMVSAIVDDVTTSEEEKILRTVLQYLNNNYYKDISEEQMMQAVEYSGTALMQYAGDRFCMLMSPQTYYDFDNPTSTVVSSTEMFGVSFSIEDGLGLYVSSVVANSNAYGRLREGDLVLQLSDIKGYGGTPNVGGHVFDEITFSQWTSVTIQAVMNLTRSATFHVLRMDENGDYDIVEIENLSRGEIKPVNSNYPYNFIEFYFDEQHNNVSTPWSHPGKFTTYKERSLDNLPEDTGYVRIIQFMDVVTTDGYSEGKISASEEFYEVMRLFKQLNLKHLVLDLKGNPGGNVAYVSDIAGMLVDSFNLSSAEKNKVTNSDGELLITTLNMPKPVSYSQKEYRVSTYNSYFNSASEKCNIVVWTDGGSASASELLTGALRDYGTAVQMGTTTYGKGIAQAWQELPFTGTVTDIYGNKTEYPWAIYYTCASYYSPLGDNIHGVGYTPDEAYNGLATYQSLWDAAINYWKA